MKRNIFIRFGPHIAFTIFFLFVLSNNIFGEVKKEEEEINAQKVNKFRANVRKLIEDQVVWTRNLILCNVDNLPGSNQATKRLVQNAIDIGNEMKLYYGEEAGNKLTELLEANVPILSDVIITTKKDSLVARNDANRRWYTNANEIATLLCQQDPASNTENVKNTIQDYLRLTTDELVDRTKKDYDAEVLAYDKVVDQSLGMADMISTTIIRKFPKKFRTDRIPVVTK